MFELLTVILVATSIMVLTFSVAALVVMPITGSIVRLRANYLPMGVSLEDVESEGGDKRVGPVVRRVSGMIMRVKRLEGLSGLYKGISPFLALNLLISIASIAFIGGSSKVTPKGTYQVPNASSLSMSLFGLVMTLVTLPCTILINRTIVTPHALPWHPVKAVKIILTPFERANPWVIYKAPGLLAATALHIFWVSFVSKGFKNLVVPELGDGLFEPPEVEGEEPQLVKIRMGRLAIFLLFQALSTFVLCPLEVLAVRLSIQRQNGGQTPVDQVPSEYAAKDEDVIGLRGEEEPYEGLVDAIKTILNEEGWVTLYTAWIVTLAGLMLGVAV
ncbi:hypothetical protein BDY24DRAFT_385458 [Mrakia frigida]|uniref:uncharacterized protein n=1 Tax=Mrakia frigida TaxID=29902 RepID=UPI003FCC1F8B